ncbi:hypothetical protein Emag_003821 [Eimeria magna]
MAAAGRAACHTGFSIEIEKEQQQQRQLSSCCCSISLRQLASVCGSWRARGGPKGGPSVEGSGQREHHAKRKVLAVSATMRLTRLLRLLQPHSLALLLLLLLLLLLPVDSVLDSATRRRLQRSRASHLMWTDSLTVSTQWQHYAFPVLLDSPGVLLGPPRGPPSAQGASLNEGLSESRLGLPLFVVVRGLDAAGFWHKLTSPCAREETAAVAEETVSVLVTSTFSIIDGSHRRFWRARVLPPGETDPYKAERAGRALAFALLQQQRRSFSQLLYADHIFPRRLSPFRDNPPSWPPHAASRSSGNDPKAAALQQQQQQQQQQQHKTGAAGGCERFSPFHSGGDAARDFGGGEVLTSFPSLLGGPLVFWLDTLFEGPTQLKGHQVAAGTITLSPKRPLITIDFPPSTFARPPEVYVQLKVNGAPALGLTRLLLVTQQRAVLYIHPNHCADPSHQWELASSPYQEVDWMAWLPF